MSKPEDMEPVNLGEKDQVSAENTEVVDPWAVDETAAVVDDSNTEKELPPTDTEQALNKLKASGVRLGTAVKDTTADFDRKLGISNVINSIGTKVKEVDDQTQVSGHVTAVVKNVSTTLGALFSNVDDKLQISTKSREIGGTLESSVSAVFALDPVKKTTTAVKEFDETHGVTRSTASTLAAGADLLADAIGVKKEQPPQPSESLALTATVDAIEKKDEDGLPSSFQK